MTDKKQWFTPLKGGPKPRKIAALDTEGNGDPSGFVCASVVSNHGRYTFTSRQSVLEYLFSKELRDHWIFAHNLEYDLGVLSAGDLRPYKVTFAGSRLLWAERADQHRHKWKLVDSTNILPNASIKDLGLMIGLDKYGLHPLLEDHIRAGLPLSLLDPADQNQVLNYCLRDADILYLAVSELQEELFSLGAELKPTVAGISMDLFRRKFMIKPWPTIDPAINRMARTAYYGARVEPYILGRASGINGYDVSSLYPSVMATCDYPHPGYLILDDNPSNLGNILQKEGVTQATVKVPDIDPPILPGRIRHHLFFPTGTITGAWPHNELRYALESGCKILQADWSIWSSYTHSPFEDFINTLYAKKRLHASSSQIREKLFKDLLNSGYGRYGLNPESGLSELVPLSSNDQWESVQGATLYFLKGWPYALRQIEDSSQPAYANAFIAAYVTAQGRIKMHGMIKDNLDRLCYTDTDSLWLKGEVATGDGLGQLRQIEEDRDFWIVAPKEYAIFSGEYLIDAKAKGIPEAHRLMYLKSGYASYDSAVGLKEGLKRGMQPSTWIQRYREKRYSLPKRPAERADLKHQDYYSTRPWEFAELHRAFDLAQAHLPLFVERHSPKLSHLQRRISNE